MTQASSITGLLGQALLSLAMRVQGGAKPPAAASAASHCDALTGLPDRRNFIQTLCREWALARRHQLAGAVVLVDLDHFKRVNDVYGRRCGDALLQRVAKACAEGLRQGDVLARFGGEEFILYLPHTDPLGALDVAERIRARVALLDFNWQGNKVTVQISAGVAALKAEHRDMDQFLRDVDEALFIAKSSGRNCVRGAVGLLPGQPSRAMR